VYIINGIVEFKLSALGKREGISIAALPLRVFDILFRKSFLTRVTRTAREMSLEIAAE
jgi:hypothetical protein